MARDEQSAGRVDELIAQLEFACSEAVRKSQSYTSNIPTSLVSTLLQGSDAALARGQKEAGYEELKAIDDMWALALRVRKSLYDRAVYLSVLIEPSQSPPPALAWPNVVNRLPPLNCAPDAAPTASASAELNALAVSCLSDIVDEVEKACINETKELYTKEGKVDALKATAAGIPESLTLWLSETRHKILGSKGHREKSWKRLWGQIDTFETLLARKTGPMDQPQTRPGIPAACFSILFCGYIQFMVQTMDRKVEQFSKLLRLWEKGKEKHERQLRPRLGSPDALQELLSLDAIEAERSRDLKLNVEKFQSSLIAFTAKYSKSFCEDLGSAAVSFIRLLDTSLRLDLLEVPPDTEVPKKKMTMKRLRKAQRIQEAVKQGGEDLSVSRMWPVLPVEFIVQGNFHSMD